MRNLHLIILQEFGIEARRLFREWERLRPRSSDYRNHRIFSLRCIHEKLIPVSIKLKSTLDTPKARQIIRKAEKDLLQARVKAINNILDQVDKEIQDCRTKLASIILQERLEQCQGFINKVSELRFNKVKQRQINKLNHLVSKKEGNITISSNNTTLNRQVQSPTSSRSHNPTPATALLPPGEGDNSPLAAVHLPLEGNSYLDSQASNNNNTTSNSVNNTTSNLINSTTSNSVNNQTNSQASQAPPLNQTLAIAHLPPGEGSNSLLGAAHLPSEAGSSPPQPNSTTAREENNSSQANSPPTNNPSRASQAGHSNNPPGQAGKALGTPPGINLLNLPLRPVQPPGKVPPPPHPPAVPAKVLPRKNLTLSGSLTFPTNLWPQCKGLFWLKGPTLWLPPGSLLT